MGALLDALPPGGTAADVAAREDLLWKYAQNVDLTWEWTDVTHQANGHTLRFSVQRDGMKLEGVRLDMSATLAQRIADLIGAVLPTPRICDVVFQNAIVSLLPRTMPITATVAAMVDESARLDSAIGESQGLVADIGKDWVLVNALVQRPAGAKLPAGTVAANYGWHVPKDKVAFGVVGGVNPPSWGGIHLDPSVTGGYVIQSVGTQHARSHSDYSQIQRLVMIQCELDGQPMDIRDVMRSPDPSVNSLVSHEGPLMVVRQPGVDGDPTPGGSSGPAVTVNAGKITGTQLVATVIIGFAMALGTIAAQRIFRPVAKAA